jgi:hypothetical protein
LNILVYGLPGSGKTKFVSTAPDVGVAACETGLGKGLATVLKAGLDYVDPVTYQEFDQICSGLVFKDKKSIALDSLSDMTSTFIKDYALSFPRAKGETLKRKAGVPELDDYGVMGEVTRRLVRKLIDSGKHVIATATLKIDKPDADTGQGQYLVCPNLPGAMSVGSTAMFDLVLCFRTRSKLRDKNDAKSRYTEHYITAKGNEGLLAKCRHNDLLGKALIPDEFVMNLETGEGTFPWILERIRTGYVEAKAA